MPLQHSAEAMRPIVESWHSRETFLHQAFLDLAWKWEKLADELERTQALIDNWRRERLDLPTRPEAIRRLVIEAAKASRRR